jgi:tetratricopeptide (TPR) repeat protein
MNMENKNQEISLFKNLWQRRVPQTFGIYLGASWAIIEFVSSLLVGRYLLSPHLIDFSIVILLSLIPSVLMIAFFHGKPGKDKWTRFEKIGIPINIVLSLMLLFFIFNEKDLGATTKTVYLENEKGEKIERAIPKMEFRKKIATFPFDNESADSTLDWLQYGFEFALDFDLSQDLFLQWSSIYQSNLLGEFPVLEKMKRYGFTEGVGIPFTLKKKIAGESFMNYFLSGSFTADNDTLFIRTLLYETKRGKLISENSFKGTDIFKLTDEISSQLRMDLEISHHHLEETKDLPVAEMLTNSIPAFKMYITGLSMLFENDYKTATEKLELAINEDPTFALAYFSLSGLDTFLNQPEKIERSVNSAMQYMYKLPELYQFMVKIQYYSSKQESEKVIALAKMRIELYPEDIIAYKLLALLLMSKNLVDEEIEAYKSILKIDPTQFEYLKKIGSLYEKKGEFEEALKYYEQYADQFPEDSSSYTTIGDLYKSNGNYQQAKTFYEKAILLEPEKISVLVSLANIEEKSGNFLKALEQYQNSLDLCKTPQDLAEVYLSLGSYYENRGQINKSIEYLQMELNECEKFQSPLILIFGKFAYLEKYIQIGKKELAFQTLETIKTQFASPFDKFVSMGKLKIYKELEDTENLEKTIEEVEILIKTFGLEMLRSSIINTKGKIHEIKGEFEQAISLYQKELELEPTDIEINKNIGCCYRKMKEFKKAEEYLQKTLKILPFDPKTYYELALLYNDMGKKEKALEHLNITLDIWKDADQEYIPAQKARAKLREWTAES